MQAMGVIDLISPTDDDAEATLVAALGSSDVGFVEAIAYASVASVFLLAAAFVFAAGAFLLTIRFGLLIFLMVLSPVAFAAGVLPGVRGWSKKWWSVFLNQAFFAPTYIFMLYVTWLLLASTDFKTLITDDGTLSSSFSVQQIGTGITVVAYFFVLIIGLVASLVIAKQMGAYGAGASLKLGRALRGQATGYVGRNTAGGAAGWALKKSERLEGTRMGRNFKRGLTLATLGTVDEQTRRASLKNVKSSKFGGTRSRADVEAFDKENRRTRSNAEREIAREDAWKRLIQDVDDPSKSAEENRKAREKRHGGSLTEAEHQEARKKDIETLQTMTVSEMGDMKTEELKAIADLLTNRQMDQIRDSKEELTESAKSEIKTARKKAQEEKFGLNEKDPVEAQKKAEAYLKDMKAADVAKLPKSVLLDIKALKHLSGEVLRRVQDDDKLTPDERKALSFSIKMPQPGGPAPHPSAAKYISSTRGANYYT